MPTQTVWVAPEVFLEHAGVTVYHIYKDDDIESGPRDFWFTLDELGAEDGGLAFDIRDLAKGADLEPNIPFLNKTDPRYAAASGAERAEFKARWEAWRETGFDEARKAVLRQAIDSGALSPL